MNAPDRAVRARNFALLIVLECCWAFAVWLAHPVTVLPNFMIRLGASPFVVGLLPALWAIGTGVGALAVGPLIARRTRLGPITGVWHLFAIIPYLGLAGVAAAAATWDLHPGLLQAAALMMFLLYDVAIGALMNVYFFLLSRVFPGKGRSRWFGALFTISCGAGLMGPLLASTGFIREGSSLMAYAALFLTSYAFMFLGSLPFFFLREPAARPAPPRTLASNFIHLHGLWRKNVHLRRYLIARMWVQVGMLTGAFAATYSRAEVGLGEHTITWFGLVAVAGEAAFSWPLGWMGSRLASGNASARAAYIRTQFAVQVLVMTALLFAALRPGLPAAMALVLVTGLCVAADLVIHPNILIEMGTPRLRADFIALGAVALMPAMALIGPLGGWVIEHVGHRWTFGLAALVGIPGLVNLWRLSSVRKTRNPGDGSLPSTRP